MWPLNSLGQYIDFAVSKAVSGETGSPLSPPARDAAAVLMQSSHSTCYLPKEWTIVGPNQKRYHCRITLLRFATFVELKMFRTKLILIAIQPVHSAHKQRPPYLSAGVWSLICVNIQQFSLQCKTTAFHVQCYMKFNMQCSV